MPKIRVLIVDDAVVVRSRVSKILSSDPELEIVGVAANGRIALAKIPQVNPDVVILDVEMPEMDGLETLAAIRKSYPHLSVIMFSTFTLTGATATLEALSLGATDYATKPSNLGSVDAANQHIRDRLIPKIKLFGSREIGRGEQGAGSREQGAGSRDRVTQGIHPNTPTPQHPNTPTPQHPNTPSPPLPLSPSPPLKRADIVAIGVSTGGPNALAVLLSELPPDLPVPIVIVQHMPPMFTKILAERLDSKCQIRVAEAVPGTVLEPGHAWIAPGDFHMIVERNGTVVRIGTHQKPPENSCRPSVDVLFRSVAQVYGARTLAVVLTGMGQDGLHGCECIRELGGQILVQDEASSVVWGMPGFVSNAGLADLVMPLDQIKDEIVRRLRHS